MVCLDAVTCRAAFELIVAADAQCQDTVSVVEAVVDRFQQSPFCQQQRCVVIVVLEHLCLAAVGMSCIDFAPVDDDACEAASRNATCFS